MEHTRLRLDPSRCMGTPGQPFKRFCAAMPLLAAAPRHPELADSNRKSMERPDVEADPHYRRTDYSSELAFESRHAFAANIARGDAGVRLAEAALHVAAEDDAIASSATVKFPVDAYLARIRKLAEDCARLQLGFNPEASTSTSTSTSSCCSLSPQEAVSAVERHLFAAPAGPQLSPVSHQQQQQQTQRGGAAAGVFSLWPAAGRSALPARTLVDHPGVWEDARAAYLNEVLVRKRGHPAALAVIYHQVVQQLLLMGALPCAVAIECGDYSSFPRGTPLPNLVRDMVCLPDGSSCLNTCSMGVLSELLRQLKRAYWPFPWDTNIDDPAAGGAGSHGGFRAAAKVALGSEEISAALRAVSATAAHRLQRGIWTSPGAGDLARALAAAERLVMLVGEEQPAERHDLAVLLLHAGRLPEAAAELSAYQRSPAYRQADPFDAKLVLELQKMLEGVVAAAGQQQLPPVLSVELMLSMGRDKGRQLASEAPVRPLTW